LSSSSPPPLKLLVIDALADLLLDDTKTSTTTLAERSRNLSAIAARLHALAATHQLAVVAINRATDTWERRADADAGRAGELLYADHARIFGRAGGEAGSKSAALGLVWANQVNARVMLARTERRRRVVVSVPVPVPAVEGQSMDGVPRHDRKRQRTEGGAVVRADDVVVRRLAVVFSSVCAPASVDFVVTGRGVETLADDLDSAPVPQLPPPPPPLRTVTSAHVLAAAGAVRPPLADVAPLDVGAVASDFRSLQPGDVPVGEAEDDEDAYWREMDDVPFTFDDIDQVQDPDQS
jgi:DNA repair protein RAD57